jgi:hypothetical protein
MRVACYVHPIVHTLGPCFHHVWSEVFADMLRSLHREAGCECVLITGRWFKGRAGLRTVRLDEVSLYQRLGTLGELPTALDDVAYRADDIDHPAFAIIAEEVARHVAGFEPDIVIGFCDHANYLAKLWPKALRLHVECGPYARNPYPSTMFFDHLGMHGRSVVGRAGRRILARPATTDGRSLVSAFRSRMAAALGSLDPFRSHDFRSRFSRLCLLPLQMSNEFPFDGLASYRSQFEFLHDVLAHSPRDVGVIVAEHPAATPVLKRRGREANMDYLCNAFPNMIFLDEFRSYCTSSQFLVPRVDGVWSVSSSVGYQALLFGRVLGTPPTTHLSSVADATTFEGFFDQLGSRTSRNVDAFLAWQLERYLVPASFFNDGRWLRRYLQRRLDAANSATDPIDAFVPIADADRLMEAWVTKAPKPELRSYAWPVDDAELFEACRHRDALVRELDALLKSTSWRLTAPLRAVVDGVTAMRQRIADRLAASGSAFKVMANIFTRELHAYGKLLRLASSHLTPARPVQNSARRR